MKYAVMVLTVLLCGCSLMPQKPAAHVPHKVGAEVGSYPNAAPQSGTERILEDQVGVTANVTPLQLATYVCGLLNGTVTANGSCLTSVSPSGITAQMFSSSVSDATPGSSVNNYAAPGYVAGVTNRWRITAASGGTTITGILGAGVADGFVGILCDESTTDVLIFPSQSSSSAAGNQFLNGGAGSVTVGPLSCLPMTYVVGNWRFLL